MTYGALASLNDQLELELTDPPVFGAFAFGADPVFFRLWDGIERISDFTATAPPAELRDGIHLAFDPPASAAYRPGDYWTFAVRAGEIANPETLVDDEPPQGPVLRRVPLAEIDWTGRLDTTISGEIEDCRRRFHPLTDQKTCCTLLVGDGVRTFGDFNSLEEAARNLPAAGGDLCLLPGLHFANLVLRDRVNVRIHGCARRTMVLPRSDAPDRPIVTLEGGRGIEVSELDLVSLFGPLVVGAASEGGRLADVKVHDCRMLARTYAVRLERAEQVEIARNEIWLLDTAEGRSAIRLGAVGALVERNALGVRPFRETPPQDGGGNDGGGRPTPPDPCDEPDRVYTRLRSSLDYARFVWTNRVRRAAEQPYRAWGGIHLLGGCEEVRVLENHVDGGAGNGVTLGGVLPGETPIEPPGETGGAAPSVRLERGGMSGYVHDEAGTPVPDVDVFLSAGGTVIGQGRSDADGAFGIEVSFGNYDVSVEAGYEIVSLAEAEFEGARYYVLVVQPAEVAVPEEQGFLYRISLEENEIERMSLSGVGFLPFTARPTGTGLSQAAGPLEAADALSSAFAPKELLGTTSLVRELVIRGNRIHDNLRAVFDDALRRDARAVGRGGISLALVETALMEDNEILDNGLSASSPVCGVFVGYGEDVEIRGNRIAGNGPVQEDYENARIEGLRGGIFVRFAGASLLGGEADAHEKPALRVVENRVDQPAGRAVTAFAFGPVAVHGNYLNSEREGRWSSLDALVGGVLLLNLGGLHRQMRFTRSADDASSTGTSSLSSASFVDATRAELLLPGGETLFNDNQLRLGPQHRSATAALLVTLDDLGMDGNQCSSFRTDLLFADAVCVAFSVRATDNSFRERAATCYFSLLSAALGLTAQARLTTMNTTALNQGDHCIIALSNGGTTGLPVIDSGNLEGNRAQCRKLAAGPDGVNAYLARAAATALLSGAAVPERATLGSRAKSATQQAVLSMSRTGAEYRRAYAREAVRLEQRLGTDSARVQEMKTRLSAGDATLRQLRVQAQLSRVEEAAVPESGAVVDGRVMSTSELGAKDAIVELVRADGTPVGVASHTDETGYFALTLQPEQAKQLETEGELHVRVTDAQGRVVKRSEAPVRVAADTAVRTQVVLPSARVPVGVLKEGTEIYRKPAAPTRTSTSTPLETVRGIGPKTAEKLRAAGIPDLESLLRTPGSTLVGIAGFDADVMRERAREAVDAAGRTRQPPAGERRGENS